MAARVVMLARIMIGIGHSNAKIKGALHWKSTAQKCAHTNPVAKNC